MCVTQLGSTEKGALGHLGRRLYLNLGCRPRPHNPGSAKELGSHPSGWRRFRWGCPRREVVPSHEAGNKDRYVQAQGLTPASTHQLALQVLAAQLFQEPKAGLGLLGLYGHRHSPPERTG